MTDKLVKNNKINSSFFSDKFKKSYTDTIELDQVNEVENPLSECGIFLKEQISALFQKICHSFQSPSQHGD